MSLKCINRFNELRKGLIAENVESVDKVICIWPWACRFFTNHVLFFQMTQNKHVDSGQKWTQPLRLRQVTVETTFRSGIIEAGKT